MREIELLVILISFFGAFILVGYPSFPGNNKVSMSNCIKVYTENGLDQYRGYSAYAVHHGKIDIEYFLEKKCREYSKYNIF